MLKSSRNHSTLSKEQKSKEKKFLFFSSVLEKSTFYGAQVSGGHTYETALDFLFLPNDWSSDISPYSQIVLLHPLPVPQSSPFSPQFATKTLFLDCSMHSHRHLTGVCLSLSDSSSLYLCYRFLVLWACSHLCVSLSISESASFSVSLSSLISMFPSAMVAV